MLYGAYKINLVAFCQNLFYNYFKGDEVMRKLYKSRTDKKICGVCGGLADYLGIDSTIMRLIMFVFIWCVGIGLLVYIAAALIMPYEDEIKQ